MTGAWIPNLVPKSSLAISILLVFCSCITSTTFGYDQSMINGLNILPSYSNYFNLTVVTTGLNTASIWIGGCLAGMTWATVTDAIGRRPSMFWAALVTIIAIILQTASQNIAMFVVARILIGFGTSASGIAGPVYLAETLPSHWRAWGLGVFNDFYYVGGLIAAGVTLGTSTMDSTWAWRAPSAIQAVSSIICIVILPFIPESPRWLAWNESRRDEALQVVALTYANGDATNPIVLTQFKEIMDTINYEKNVGQTLSFTEVLKTPTARKRVLLAISAAVFSTIAGNVIASYYLGSMLDNAGITDTTTQLQINVILNAFCLVCSLVGTWAADRWGRKPTTALSTGLLTIFIFLVGGLTEAYGNSMNTAGIYATTACIFLFQGSYSFGWTPILYLYPPEVLNYPIRSVGMGIFQFFLNGSALLFVFAMPIAIANIGWITYMINGGWDVLMLVAVMYWWVETKGKTLEEVDEALDGVKHFDTPNLGSIEVTEEKTEFTA